MGDTGLLVAIHLARHFDVVGISSKPGLISGQELGLRLARPHEWTRDYRVPFDRYRRLDAIRTVHGSLIGLDADARSVRVRSADGCEHDEPYDVLVIATGVTNGFWRTPTLQSAEDIERALAEDHSRIAEADSVAVIGGGAAAVSSAWNIAKEWPAKKVNLYFPGDRALTHHHPRTWNVLSQRLTSLGVGLHPGHRAELGAQAPDRITSEPITWSTGQPPASAAAVLWAIGRVTPNTSWVPDSLLNDDGFVRVDPFLRADAYGIYAIGDVAATDPLRSSARARADVLLAKNIRADLGHGRARPFRPLKRRWGSVLGAQGDRLEVFGPSGRPFTIPAWRTLQPWIVGRGIYKGIRAARTRQPRP